MKHPLEMSASHAPFQSLKPNQTVTKSDCG